MKRALVFLGLVFIASGSVWAQVTVPDVVGLAQNDAEDALTSAGLTTGAITTQCDPVIPAGSIVSQDPVGGTVVPNGTPVNLVVSSGPSATVPDVSGLDVTAAVTAILAAGLTPDGSVECDNVNPVGTVASQSPIAGSTVACGSVVFGIISGGPCALVPDVVGKTQAEAESDFAATGIINVSVSTQCDNVVPAGNVISQDPPAGTQIFSTWETVNIVVSTGPCPVTVPDLTGLTVTQASDVLTSAGLLLGVQTNQCSNLLSAGRVFGQNPGPASVVLAGTAVDINVSTGPCATVPGVESFLYLDAVDAITSAGLVVGTIDYQCNNLVPTGRVIVQSPSPMTSVEPGSAVDLVLSTGPCPVTVPDVVGLDQASAEAEITSAGLVVGTITPQCDDLVPVGQVISQAPAGGASVAPGSAVDLVVSSGVCPVTVPDVVGLDQASAEAAITSAGLTVGTVYEVCSPSVPAGEVFGQIPAAGSQVAPGTSVSISVSLGPCPVIVPNVVNFTQAAAEVQIQAVGLVVGTVTTACSDTISAGAVISQNPAAGSSVLSGTAVDLVVSTGPCPVTVPDVVGLAQAAAESAITSAGLVVGTVTTACDDVVPAGAVISQSPVAGASVAPATAVDLVVSSGPCNTIVPDVIGLDQAAAESAITSAGLVVGAVTTACDDVVPAGAVISQDPVGGTPATLGSAVNLLVSTGPCVAVVPDVVGLDLLDAENALNAAGLLLGTVVSVCDDLVPAGAVISQDPVASTTVPLGSAVNLVVSTGPCNAVAPDVVGLGQAAAESAITAAGLLVGTVTTACDNVVPAGAVIAQDPAGGTSVTLGTSVNLVVSTGPCPVAVPDVVGLAQASAQAAIAAAGLAVGDVSVNCSNTVPAGDVISQSPAGGSLVAPGSSVNLVVSSGPCLVIVPNVVGQAQAAAQAAITDAGLTSSVTLACSDTVPAGNVISQLPVGGTSVTLGSNVALTVSTGPCPVEVPNVVDQAQAAAQAAIAAAGLTSSVTLACSDTVPAGNVISQSPAGGSLVAPGSTVGLVVSSGPCPVLVTVPDVVGVELDAALNALVAAGLLVETVEVCDDNIPAGEVINQDPAGGSSVPEGTTVTLTVSSGPCNAVVPDVVGLTLEAAQAALAVYNFNVLTAD
ncbi:MAG TPA: PASTA domain-containing protein, partial [Candidatus Hydrogenedentes bacterium]|nr:PASTA domain-containing protein [Candidatus Hydrogenedentota bacterium]